MQCLDVNNKKIFFQNKNLIKKLKETKKRIKKNTFCVYYNKNYGNIILRK